MWNIIGIAFILAYVSAAPRPDYPLPRDESLKNMRGFVEGDTGTTDWFATGQATLTQALTEGLHVATAKNIILFIGDGMGVPTVTAARIYQAQLRKLMGEKALLAWDKFPHTALSQTYTVDYQVPDSAGTATSFLTGEKTKKGVIGTRQNVPRGDCTLGSKPENQLKSILKYSIDEGKWTGVVSTTRITHATPAASYANSPERNWENDSDIPEEDKAKCKDIASQLIDREDNKKIRVVLGGGRREFYPETTPDPEYPDENGQRTDNRTLPEEWLAQKSGKAYYVMNQTEFDAVPDDADYLLGLFEPSHMQYEIDRTDPAVKSWGEPSIAQMVEKSINILSKNKDGFFLLVEGGRIDHAHHDSVMTKALNDTVALSDAVAKARELTSTSDTLIIVTADHSHVNTISGYPYISTDILGLATDDKEGTLLTMDDGKPFLTLGYMNGPGYAYHRFNNADQEVPRKDLTNDTDIATKDYPYDTGMLLDSETHGGEEVAIYASGPMSHLFHGTKEQHFIAHAMMYASCVGPNKDHCEKPRPYPGCPDNSSSAHGLKYSYVSLCGLIVLLLKYFTTTS